MKLLLPFITAVALTAGAAVSFVWGQEATARAGEVAVTSGWARATPPGASVGSAYVEIRNEGSGPDRLIGVESPSAGMAMLHQSGEDGDVAQMRPATEGILVPPGATVTMAPGGFHIMLMDIRAPLTRGETLPVTLRFETAGTVTLALPIEPVGSPGPTGEAAHSGH